MGVSERRERERSRRRIEILRAASDVFAEHGLEGASMDAIATRAELGKATLYYYFPNKQALFDAVLANGMERFFGSLPQAKNDDTDLVETFEALLRSFLDFFRENRGLLHLMAPYMSRLNRPIANGHPLPPSSTAPPRLPDAYMGPHRAFRDSLVSALDGTPWQARQDIFLAFLTDVLASLSQLHLEGFDREAEDRISFYVDLLRGRVASGLPPLSGPLS